MLTHNAYKQMYDEGKVDGGYSIFVVKYLYTRVFEKTLFGKLRKNNLSHWLQLMPVHSLG